MLNSLLNGSKFNYIILGVNGNPGAVQKVILTTAKPASPVNTAQNNSPPPPEEPQDEENYGEPEPQPSRSGRAWPVPPPAEHAGPYTRDLQSAQPQPQPTPDNNASTRPTQPNGAKTPEQLLQELQQMQQQQQQMQEQLNPANRQPPP